MSSSTKPTPPITITPVPTDDEVAAIVAAISALLSGNSSSGTAAGLVGMPGGEMGAHQESNWRFSNRWWSPGFQKNFKGSFAFGSGSDCEHGAEHSFHHNPTEYDSE